MPTNDTPHQKISTYATVASLFVGILAAYLTFIQMQGEKGGDQKCLFSASNRRKTGLS